MRSVNSMRILFLEPFYGGSHRDVADNLLRHSAHEITIETLSAHHWKWRMRGSGLHFAHAVSAPDRYDLVVTTGMTTVADLQSRWGANRPPIALYVHETQLTYPVPSGESVDMHLAFTDVQNLLAAELVRFNSQTHLSAFLNNLRIFLGRMPKPRLPWAHDEIARKSGVLYPGIALPSVEDHAPHGVVHARGRVHVGEPDAGADARVPLIVWNHRWEFDKAPEVFFEALRRVKDRGIPFSLAILGENFQAHPGVFEEAERTFADQIVQFGFASDRAEYEAWLGKGDIVVSTAIQENFGISVLEAIASGCFPLLPRRLSYPEVIPERFHDQVLYDSPEGLTRRLGELLRDASARRPPQGLEEHARSFSWERRIQDWDEWMSAAVEDVDHGKG